MIKLYLTQINESDYCGNPLVMNVYRIPLSLFSKQCQILLELPCDNIILDHSNYAGRKAHAQKVNMLVFDFFKNKHNQIDVTEIRRLGFNQKHCITPAAFLKKLEFSIFPVSVDCTEKGESSFRSNVSTSERGILFEPEEVSKMPYGTLNFSLTCMKLEEVDKVKHKFDAVLAKFLGKNPILPEEKIFTSIRAICFAKMAKDPDSAELKSFFQLIDHIEFTLRKYCHEHDLSLLKSISRSISEEIDRFPYQKEVFKNGFEILYTLVKMIELIEDWWGEAYLQKINDFFNQVAFSPLKMQLKCTFSLMDSIEVASKNFSIRAAQLMAQCKFSGVDLDLMPVKQAFSEKNWVQANVCLSNLMNSPFFQKAVLDEANFVHYRLAASIISLVDFFKSAVTSSARYQWVNYTALNAALNYVQNSPKELEKGQLTPLKNWVLQLQECDLPLAFQSFFQALKKLADLEKEFKEEYSQKFVDWLQSAKGGRVDGNSYPLLCDQINGSLQKINAGVEAVSTEVHRIQSEMIILAGKRNVIPIEHAVLKEQLEHLNQKITNICSPFLSFLHNFNDLFGKSGTLKPIDSFSLFETDPAKLFPFTEWKEEESVVIESQEPPSEVEEQLEDVFKDTNRRKVLMRLNDFFKERALIAKIVSGKGSHIKIYLGNKPIVIPDSKELKIGTAGAIRRDILDRLKELI